MSRRRRSRGSGAPNPAIIFAILTQVLNALSGLQVKITDYKAAAKTDGIKVSDAVEDIGGVLQGLVSGILKEVAGNK